MVTEEEREGMDDKETRHAAYEMLAERKRREASELAAKGGAAGAEGGMLGGGDWRTAAFGPGTDDIAADIAGSLGLDLQPKRARKKGKKRQLDDKVSRALGSANILYAQGKLEDAKRLLMHVVKASPDTLDAFQTLAQIYEELGEKEKALKFMLIAAHLDDKNTEQWKLLAQKSMESNELRQAVYCLSKVLQLRPGDAECRRARADIYEMVGEGSKAIESYEELLKSNPNDVHVVHSLARCCYAAKDGKRAERVLEAWMDANPSEVDLTSVNMLAEIYMFTRHYSNVVKLIDQNADVFGYHEGGDEEIPLDLAAKRGLALVRLKQTSRAELDLQLILAADVVDYADLFMEAARVLEECGLYNRANEMYVRLLETADGNEGALDLDLSELWSRASTVKRQLGAGADAIKLLEKAHDEKPEDEEVRLQLAEAYAGDGDLKGAQELLMDEAAPPTLIQPVLRLLGEAARRGAELQSHVFDETMLSEMRADTRFRDSTVRADVLLAMRRAELLVKAGAHAAVVELLSPIVWQSLHCIAADRRWKKRESQEKLADLGADEDQIFSALPARETFEGEVDYDVYLVYHDDRGPMHKYRAHPLISDVVSTEGGISIIEMCVRSMAAAGPDLKDAVVMLTEAKDAYLERGRHKVMPLHALATELAEQAGMKSDPESQDLLAEAADAFALDEVRHRRRADPVWRVNGPVLPTLKTCEEDPENREKWEIFADEMRAPDAADPPSRPMIRPRAVGAREARLLQLIANTNPECVEVRMMLGNHFMAQHRYGRASAYYLAAYRLARSDPLTSLCAGIALVKLCEFLAGQQCSGQADADKPDSTPRGRRLLQAFALLAVYREALVAQGGTHYEADYNLARAAHQVDVREIARRRYQAAIDGARAERRPGLTELARTIGAAAGHNLSVLLRRIGAVALGGNAMQEGAL